MLGAATPLQGSGPHVVPASLPPSQPAPQSGLIWVPTEHSSAAASGVADGSGTAVAQIQIPGNVAWRVTRVTVSTTSSATTTARVYLDSTAPANLADISYNGNGDVADEINPILVKQGGLLIVQWTGATVGALCTFRAQYEAGNYNNGLVIGAG